jgi:RNA polymerase sigma-70 factor (ECF subfamily)
MDRPEPQPVTRILARVREGDEAAQAELFELVYGQLQRLAQGIVRHERPGHTLQATALLHEAWMKLVDLKRAAPRDRAHFMAIAARSMRQILVDHARRKGADKRGGDWGRVTLDGALAHLEGRTVDVLALEDALERLAAQDARKARVVELRFYGGLTVPEVAEALGVSARTVEGDWFMARAWLRRELER